MKKDSWRIKIDIENGVKFDPPIPAPTFQPVGMMGDLHFADFAPPVCGPCDQAKKAELLLEGKSCKTCQAYENSLDHNVVCTNWKEKVKMVVLDSLAGMNFAHHEIPDSYNPCGEVFLKPEINSCPLCELEEESPWNQTFQK